MPKKTPSHASRFPGALEIAVLQLIKSGKCENFADAALFFDLGHPRLSRLLNGSAIAGSKTLARICSKLDRDLASDLLQAYLLDEADTVVRSARRSANVSWGPDTLVEVNTVPSLH